MKLYGTRASGNCYKAQLAASILGFALDWQELDILAGAAQQPEFLALNANGKVPLLQLDDGRVLPESNAILCYLAHDTKLLPQTRFEQARVMQWLFFEQYSHEPAIAVARFICKFLPSDHPRRSELPVLQARGHKALAVMEVELATSHFIAGAEFSIADIALFAYTHDAAAGGFDLTHYPNVQNWLARVCAQPGFVAQSA
jgi:glutathione S-transferase